MDGGQRRAGRAVMGALLLVGLAALGYALYVSGWMERIRSVEELRDMIASAGALAGTVYFLLQMMTVIIAPIPSNISMLAGALALGFGRAAILGVLAVIAGSVIVFLAARKLGRAAVHRLIDRSVVEKYMPIIEEKQDMFLFLAMLFPFFPDDALCMLAGLTDIPLARFVVIMVLTRPWGLIAAAMLGSGRIVLPLWGWVLMAAFFFALFVLVLKYSTQLEGWVLERVHRLLHKGGR